jgi:hypothetical protein
MFEAGSAGNALVSDAHVASGSIGADLIRSVVHGVAGGLVSGIEGHGFGTGFEGAFLGELVSPIAGSSEKLSVSNGANEITTDAVGDFVNGLTSGVVSKATGGRFEDGFVSGVMSYQFNHNSHGEYKKLVTGVQREMAVAEQKALNVANGALNLADEGLAKGADAGDWLLRKGVSKGISMFDNPFKIDCAPVALYSRAIGTDFGATVGGLSGGAIGTLVEPGGGTVAGTMFGEAGGARLGGLAMGAGAAYVCGKVTDIAASYEYGGNEEFANQLSDSIEDGIKSYTGWRSYGK